MVRSLPANAGDGFNPSLEDPTCHGATKPVCLSLCSRAQELQLLKPMSYNKRSHCNKLPLNLNWRKPAHSNEDPAQPKIILKKLRT